MFLSPSKRPTCAYVRTVRPNLPVPSFQLTSLVAVTQDLAHTLLKGAKLQVRLGSSGSFWEASISRVTQNKSEKPKVSSPFRMEFRVPFHAPLFEELRSNLFETQHLLGLRVNSASENSFALTALRIASPQQNSLVPPVIELPVSQGA